MRWQDLVIWGFVGVATFNEEVREAANQAIPNPPSIIKYDGLTLGFSSGTTVDMIIDQEVKGVENQIAHFDTARPSMATTGGWVVLPEAGPFRITGTMR